MELQFQSTLSVRRATYRPYIGGLPIRISIHALRKESDIQNRPDKVGEQEDFNPRSP